MPRKGRTPNSEKTPKLWIAPEWSARLRDNRRAHALTGDFSRYLDLADKALANDTKDGWWRPDTVPRRGRIEEPPVKHANGNGRHAIVPAEDAEALLARGAGKVVLPKPPRHPVYPKPPKLVAPKPPATPRPPKPKKFNFPKPPRRDW